MARGRKSEILTLPPEYEVISLSKDKAEYLNTLTGFSSERKPPIDPKTFGSMAFTAARILIPRFRWNIDFLKAKEASREILESCKSVLQAASHFTLLGEGSGPSNLSVLDEVLVTLDSNWLLDISEIHADLKAFKILSFELLRNIQEFRSSLRSPTLKDSDGLESQIPYHLPTLQQWQSLQMAHRAEAVKDQASSVKIEIEKVDNYGRRGRLYGSLSIERQKAITSVRFL